MVGRSRRDRLFEPFGDAAQRVPQVGEGDGLGAGDLGEQAEGADLAAHRLAGAGGVGEVDVRVRHGRSLPSTWRSRVMVRSRVSRSRVPPDRTYSQTAPAPNASSSGALTMPPPAPADAPARAAPPRSRPRSAAPPPSTCRRSRTSPESRGTSTGSRWLC